MAYNRVEDQYRVPKAKEMVEELNRVNKCNSSIVMNYKHINFEGFPHAGTLSHICSLKKGHLEKCQCKCGATFFKIG